MTGHHVYKLIAVAVLALRMAPDPLAADPRGGGTLVSAAAVECRSFNPYLAGDVATWRVACLLYDSLLRYDDDLKPVGALARNWQVSEDGKSWTFELRKGVRFHDGEELTAEDVEFTLNYIRAPRGWSTRRTRLDELAVDPRSRSRIRFDSSDTYSFTVHFRKPALWAEEEWATLPILPRHRFVGDGADPGEFARHSPVGSGPFRLLKVVPGDEIVFEAFENHFTGRPRFDRIVFRTVPDDRERMKLLKSRAFDHAEVPLTLLTPGTDRKWLKGFTVYRQAESSYRFIGWQCDPEKTRFFADPRVRRAMTRAIDVDRLIAETLRGEGVRVPTIFGDRQRAGQETSTADSASPDEAREMLNAAGWYDTDGDGVLDRAGLKFSFFLDAPVESSLVRKQAEMVCTDLRKLGIDARPRFSRWEEFQKDRVLARDFEAAFLAWHLPVEPDPYAWFHSSAIPSRSRPDGLNRIGYSNSRVDALLETGRWSADPAARDQAYRGLTEVLAEESPYTLLYQPIRFGVVSKRVHISKLGATRKVNPVLRMPVLEVSRLGMLADDFLRDSWVLLASPRADLGLR